MDNNSEISPADLQHEIPKKENSPEKLRTRLLDGFQENLQTLREATSKIRQNETPRTRPRVAVIVSLWEEDNSMIASKMFNESLSNLKNQAESSFMDLDFIVVANNGGGKTRELGEETVANLVRSLKSKLGEDKVNNISTGKPTELNDPTIPWNVEIPLSESTTEGQDRCFLIVQPFDKLNAGKIRAIRDVSASLYSEILKGYSPNAIFQMDAETILEYVKTHLTLIKSPFRAMYDALKRRDKVVAIGTKDRFEPMDPETGKPLGVPMPLAQESMTQMNKGKRENFISLPGGALIADPLYYVAGMKTITENTVGDVAEDYLFTQILREYARNNNAGDIVKLNSLNVIMHLNRCPQGENAVKQLLRWKRQGAAVDKIFPDSKYKYGPLINYAKSLIRNRIKKALNGKYSTSSIVNDIKSIPGIIELLKDKEVADMVSGQSSWIHNKARS